MNETGQPQGQEDEAVPTLESGQADPESGTASTPVPVAEESSPAPAKKENRFDFLSDFAFVLPAMACVLGIPLLVSYICVLPVSSYSMQHPKNTEFFTDRNRDVFNKMSLSRFATAQSRAAWNEKQEDLVYKIRTNNYSSTINWKLKMDGEGGKEMIYAADMENVALVPAAETGRSATLIHDKDNGCLAVDDTKPNEKIANDARALLGELDRRRQTKGKDQEEKYGTYAVDADGKVGFSPLKSGQRAFDVCPSI